MRAPRVLIWAAIAAVFAGTAAPAAAHQLNVFAWIDGETVVVEGTFPGGRAPKSGTVKVFDGEDRLLRTLPIDSEGKARFPLEDADGGLRIEMSVSEGHDDYWILTPEDIAKQAAE